MINSFFQHSIEHLGKRLGVSDDTVRSLASYISNTGGLDFKHSLKIIQSADSPSAKKIIEILKLDEDAEESKSFEKIDEHHIKQHDYRPITTHTPNSEPATQNYSLLSAPAGQPINAAAPINKYKLSLCMKPPLSKKAVVINSIEISEEEQAQATKTRKSFEEMLDIMNRAFEHLNLLNNALAEITDTAPLEGMRKLFKQYKRRTQAVFNEFVEALGLALEEMNKTVSDSEMVRIQDTIVAEVREIRDGVEKLLVWLKEPQDPDFIKNFTETAERLNLRREGLNELISDSLFSHLDYDVLGKIRLG